MITAKMQADGSFIVGLDAVEKITIRRLSDAYGINYADMLIGCINKGIDVIGKQVKDADDNDRDVCEGG